MFNQFRKNNVESVTVGLVKILKVRVHSSTVTEALINHPQYPSILAISDCLSDWRIENNVYKISNEEFTTKPLSYPFIAHLKEKRGRFILVREFKNGIVCYSDEKHDSIKISLAEFLERWSGILLYAEATEKSGDKNYKDVALKKRLFGARIPAIILFAIATFIFALIQSPGHSWLLLSAFLKFFGVIVSVLLLINSIDASNPFIQNLCNLSKKSDCNALLKSDAAKVTPWLSWSEVGFFYFVGSLTSQLSLPFALPFLFLLCVSSVTYSFYSIGYQWKNNNWCILCCTIQVLLWLDAIVYFLSGPSVSSLFQSISNITFSQWFAFVLIFTAPIVMWSFFKPFLLKSSQLKPLHSQLRKFKQNSDIFRQTLTAQAKYSVPAETNVINLGNANAETTITMVSNPFCTPCAKAHAVIGDWLANRIDFNLKLVFMSSDFDDQRTAVARHLAALSRQVSVELMEKALNDWYSAKMKNYNVWAKKYPAIIDSHAEDMLKRHDEWCEVAEITATPTIFINGYKLPAPYRLEDIKYFLSDK